MRPVNYVKTSITLPRPLARFVYKQARRRARRDGSNPNLSAVIAEMIVQARSKELAGNGHDKPEGGA